ncbi:hypothetical protein EYD10_17982 [Varanus komodoensis]|nr:hypothetical protein EYD10_17982 [Varanus komodoensis]
MGWMRANKLKLNPDKMEVLLVGGSSSWVGDLDLALNGVALPLKDRVLSLGVVLDPDLSLETQVTVVGAEEWEGSIHILHSDITGSVAGISSMIPKNYQHVLAFAFAMHEINNSPMLLPNVTLGSKIFDNFFNAIRTSWTILDLLWRGLGNPAFKCNRREKQVAVLGGLTSQNSVQMANILNMVKIPQLSYGSFDPMMGNKIQFPGLYRMMPNEDPQYLGIIHLFRHFGWNWFGLILPDDDSGETFLRTLRPRLFQNSICIAWTQVIPRVTKFLTNEIIQEKLDPIMSALLLNEINVILVYGDSQSLEGLRLILYSFEISHRHPLERVWIITAQWDFTAVATGDMLTTQSFNGTMSLIHDTTVVPGFQDFLESINPLQSTIYFLQQFWVSAFLCSFPQFNLHLPNKESCTGEEKLGRLPAPWFEMEMSGQSYSIYNSVYTVAHALHAMHSCRTKQKARGSGEKWSLLEFQPWQLHPFLRNIRFNNSAQKEILFDENWELAGGYDLINLVTFPNQSFQRVRVGRIDPRAPAGNEFSINSSAVTWNPKFKQYQQAMPHSTCVENCHPGQSMIVRQGEQTCCYDCFQCAEGMISIKINAEECVKCLEDQYPNKNQDHCIPKEVSYLSYQESLGAALLSLALVLSVVTLLVLWIFIQHRNTPIVKANNWSLTQTLLFSLLFCFLCSLLFIGQPGKATCLLRQTVFGIIFSISVSSVLAKTITVVLAFMATKPGNRMRKWVGKRLAASVIILSALIQTGICAGWWLSSPPFPEFDMHSQISQIIVQCNEGSDLMFYIVLSYMGFLAMVSLTVAFLARKLPNTFNEAKMITFSMLLPKNYQHVLALAFAIHELNKDNTLLPNITLLPKIYDNAFSPWKAVDATLHLLFIGQGGPLNYRCGMEKRLVATIGGLTSPNSIQIDNILNIYKIPQLSYGSFDPVLSDKTHFPMFFQMVPNESSQYDGIVQLLKYFGWNWIGLLVPEGDSGETFLQTLKPMLFQNDMCIAFTEFIPTVKSYTSNNKSLAKHLGRIASTVLLNKVNLLLLYGDGQSMEGLRIIWENYEILMMYPMDHRVWIATARWDVTSVFSGKKFTPKSLNGTLSFALHTNVVPGFQDFLEALHPLQSSLYLIHHFWFTAFLCSIPQHDLSIPGQNHCTGQEKLRSLPGIIFEMGMSGESYNIYNAVYAVAHALHAMEASMAKQKAMQNQEGKGSLKAQTVQELKVAYLILLLLSSLSSQQQLCELHSFLRNTCFNNNAGEEILFDVNGDVTSGYDILNLIMFPNESFQRVRVGRMDPRAPDRKAFTINGSAILWNHQFKGVWLSSSPFL